MSLAAKHKLKKKISAKLRILVPVLTVVFFFKYKIKSNLAPCELTFTDSSDYFLLNLHVVHIGRKRRLIASKGDCRSVAHTPKGHKL